MVQLPVNFGKWIMRDQIWHFMVDSLKGGRFITLGDGSTYHELVEMVHEDYMLDKKSEVELSYPLPEPLLKHIGVDSPPIYVNNDRQVRSMVDLANTHLIRLCVSIRSGLVDQDAENDNMKEEDEDEDDQDWNEENVDSASDDSIVGGRGGGDAGGNGGGGDNFFMKHAKAYFDGIDYTVYGKVGGEDEDDEENMDYKTYELECVTPRFVGRGRNWSDGIFIGKCFDSKKDLISELRLTAIMRRYAYRVEKSDKNLFVAKCHVEECKWKLRGATKNEPEKFWVTIYDRTHTCSVTDRIAKRKLCTPQYVGWLFLESFGIIEKITPKHVLASMWKQFAIKMSYTTAYRALLHAQKLVRGSPEDGYERLPSLLHGLEQTNPGTQTALELDEENRFKYLFLAFGASIEGFRYLRRVIVVDGTHLTGPYGGVMLVAAAQDGNFQIFPLAFGIVDSENDASWEWFFTKLASCITTNDHLNDPLVIVSDRHTSIKNAIEKILPWAKRGICYYHLQNNIISKFRGKHLLYLVKNAAYAYTMYDYNRYMASLRAVNPDLATYLEEADPSLWSRVHFAGDRYNIKTSNIAESINSVVKKAKGYPISFLLEFIQEKLGTWYCKRRLDAMNLTTTFSRGAEFLMAIREYYAGYMTAERVDEYRFIVKGGHRDCVVDLHNRTCECGVWDYEKIPCSHAICAAPELEIHLSTLPCPSYGRDYLFSAYSRNILPKNCTVKLPDTVVVKPPLYRRPPGRQKKSRWQSWLEIAKTKGSKPRKVPKQYACSNCNQPGHTKPNCVTKPEKD